MILIQKFDRCLKFYYYYTKNVSPNATYSILELFQSENYVYAKKIFQFPITPGADWQEFSITVEPDNQLTKIMWFYLASISSLLVINKIIKNFYCMIGWNNRQCRFTYSG